MSTIVAVAICLLYFGCVLVGAPIAGPVLAPWLLAGLSAVFVWCYVVFARGSAGIALGVVAVVTLVLPVAALFAIAWPIYGSWSRSSASIWNAFQERGVFGGVELLVPLVAAALCAGALGRIRPRIADKPDVGAARRLP